MGGEVLAIVVLVGIILYQGWQNWAQRRFYEAKTNGLLDRLMARNYETFIQGEMTRRGPVPWQYGQPPDEERGIPV